MPTVLAVRESHAVPEPCTVGCCATLLVPASGDLGTRPSGAQAERPR
jgi:hypothetical protein